MSELTFKIGGSILTASDLEARKAYAPRKAKAQAPDKFHKGWIVEGYGPSVIDAAEADAHEQCAKWAAMDEAQRAKKIKEGQREPKPWSLDAWMGKNKRKRVARPYSTPQAADECAALAVRAGWTHVVVTALEKGTAQVGMAW